LLLDNGHDFSPVLEFPRWFLCWPYLCW